MRHHTRKTTICSYAKTKTKISCVVTAQLISITVFTTLIVQSLFFTIPLLKSKNSKLLVCFCDCTGWFVSDLAVNPDYWFSSKCSYGIAIRSMHNVELQYTKDAKYRNCQHHKGHITDLIAI